MDARDASGLGCQMKRNQQLDMFAPAEPAREFIPHPDEWSEVWLEEQAVAVDVDALRGVKRREEA